MRRKLLLINPRMGEEFCYSDLKIQPLSLAYIAALTPSGWDVELIDEFVDPFEVRDADLVGITAMTATVNRAYEIARTYRDRGVRVVMGGIHVSMVPEEALKFCDSVVVGEAESVWPTVIRDFESGTLKDIYRGGFLPLDKLPRPRRDIFKDKYLFDTIQTSRGCPMNCDFCSVTVFNGNRFRMRPVEDVLDELETLGSKFFFFIDDNLIGYGEQAQQRATELFKGMIKRKINKLWATQVSLNFADNDEVLDYASRSGCRAVLLGLESVSKDTLHGMNKNLNLKYGVEYYEKLVKKLHKYGIMVNGQILLGNDHDLAETIRKTVDFYNRSGVDLPYVNLPIAFPGTKLFERLRKEGRLLYERFPEDWEKYEGLNLTFLPKNLTRDQLENGCRYIEKHLYSFKEVARRALKAFFYTHNFIIAMIVWQVNSNYRKTAARRRNI